MSIDYGDKRVGIGLTDPLQIIASGYKTLENNEQIIKNIYEVCIEKNVESIVVGLPFNENSGIGDAAKKVLIFADKLKDFFKSNNASIIFYEQDERYTTRDAYEIMKTNKVKRKNKKKIVDQIAAVRILEDFMKNGNKKKLEF